MGSEICISDWAYGCELGRSQIIVKTPVKAMAMDINVLIDIVSFRNIGDKIAVNIGAQANNRRAVAAEVVNKA